MTVNKLINILNKIEDKEKVILLYDGYGWANLEKIVEEDYKILLYEEQNSLFSDN